MLFGSLSVRNRDTVPSCICLIQRTASSCPHPPVAVQHNASEKFTEVILIMLCTWWDVIFVCCFIVSVCRRHIAAGDSKCRMPFPRLCWLFSIYTVSITLITMADKHFSVLKMIITLMAFLNLLKPATSWHSFLSAARYSLWDCQ